MQLAIVSDIHSNLQAWNAVLLDARSLDIDTFLCLGDIVGYGPNPAEVLSSVHENVEHLVLGNHDAAVCGKLNPDLFHDSAAELIRWTQTRLNSKATKFLKSLPLSVECAQFRCSHGDISDPGAFNYISEPEDAAASWAAFPENLFFVGHTHEPAIFVLGESGTPRAVDPQDFVVEDYRRHIVNPGSVGQPRDGYALASYCIFEAETRSVFWRRVPFDLDQYIKAFTAEGLDESVNAFLKFDPRRRAETARTYTDFSPASSDTDKTTSAVSVRQLDLLAGKAERWRRSFTAILSAMLFLLCALCTAGFLNATSKSVIPASSSLQGQGPVLASLQLGTAPGLPLSDFDVLLGNKRRQAVSITEAEQAYLLTAASRSNAPLILQSPKIPVEPGSRLSLEVLIRKSSDFEGSAWAFVGTTRRTPEGAECTPRFLVKEPNIRRKDGFLMARHTFDVPANTSEVYFGLEMTFNGSIEISQLELTKKE